jgi:hypothetical protein
MQVWRVGIVGLVLSQVSISLAISHPVDDDFLGDLVGPVQTVIVKAQSSEENHQFHQPMVQTYHFALPAGLPVSNLISLDPIGMALGPGR